MKRTQPIDVERDRWGRPVIGGQAYTRASTLAKTLDDTTALSNWKSRMAVLGMSRNPDLVALAATTQPTDTKALDDLVDKAQEFAGSARGRNTGTSIHAASEMVDYFEDTSHLPADLLRDALAYRQACEWEGLTPILAETFVVNPDVGAAGSFDRLMYDEQHGRYVIADIKTGSKDDANYVLRYQGLSWATQLAIYAHGTPWAGESVGWSDLDAAPPDLTRAVILYIPRGSGVCHPLWIDLEVGWEAAQLASKVHKIRKAKVAA